MRLSVDQKFDSLFAPLFGSPPVPISVNLCLIWEHDGQREVIEAVEKAFTMVTYDKQGFELLSVTNRLSTLATNHMLQKRAMKLLGGFFFL
jgi:hypothetical protein